MSSITISDGGFVQKKYHSSLHLWSDGKGSVVVIRTVTEDMSRRGGGHCAVCTARSRLAKSYQFPKKSLPFFFNIFLLNILYFPGSLVRL